MYSIQCAVGRRVVWGQAIRGEPPPQTFAYVGNRPHEVGAYQIKSIDLLGRLDQISMRLASGVWTVSRDSFLVGLETLCNFICLIASLSALTSCISVMRDIFSRPLLPDMHYAVVAKYIAMIAAIIHKF